MQLEAREAELDAVRDQKATALDAVHSDIERLEGDISDIQGRIQAQIQAASSDLHRTPAGRAVASRRRRGLDLARQRDLSSPFGWRWGRMHEGIDIAVLAGTPIRAAQGAGGDPRGAHRRLRQHTCIDHGGGLSSCYAHQSSYATSVGASVGQGDVIGYVGCTGGCFGDHLHFEIRASTAAPSTRSATSDRRLRASAGALPSQSVARMSTETSQARSRATRSRSRPCTRAAAGSTTGPPRGRRL